MNRSTLVRFGALAVSLGLMMGIAGCGKPQTATVSGKVTLDGTPIANGTIAFLPMGGSSASAGGIIQDGQYAVEMPPGKKSVQISAMKAVGKRQAYKGDPNSPVVDDVRETIPSRYNAASTLTLEVPAGRSEQDFPLKAVP